MSREGLSLSGNESENGNSSKTLAIENTIKDFKEYEHFLRDYSGLKGLLKRINSMFAISWGESGFDLEKVLSKVEGDIIEFGGPTSEKFGREISYEFLKELADKTGKEVYISNIEPGSNLKHYYPDLPTDSKYVDFISDATRMPVANNSLAGVIFSRLPGLQIPKLAIKESHRVLKPGGVLRFQGLSANSLQEARSKKYWI